MARIKWDILLNEERKRQSQGSKNNELDIDQNLIDHRNEFEKDFDRLISSSSVRRLQDKAQVFPLQENDFTRTRLTHSMEVSGIARSFGRWLEDWLMKNNKLSEKKIGQIPAILASAGIAHDLGNPPFGHYGEDVIKNWFANKFKIHSEERKKQTKEDKEIYSINYFLDQLTNAEKNDFLNFDGNAQSVRILTKLQFLNDQYGLNLSYGTLSVLFKYPWSSSELRDDKSKFGYLQKDRDIAEEVISKTIDLGGGRNPLTFFLEAADDIAYRGADVEDGVKKNVIKWEIEFHKVMKKLESLDLPGHQKIIEKHDSTFKKQVPNPELISVQNFRVWIQGILITEAKRIFVNNYHKIMEGTFKGELLDGDEKAEAIIEVLKSLAFDCFSCKEVLTLELVGDKVISDLLDIFVDACLAEIDVDKKGNIKSKGKNEKIIKMISDNFLHVSMLEYSTGKKKTSFNDLTTYERLLLVTDFISGMTDSFAVDLHQKLSGVKLP